MEWVVTCWNDRLWALVPELEKGEGVVETCRPTYQRDKAWCREQQKSGSLQEVDKQEDGGGIVPMLEASVAR